MYAHRTIKFNVKYDEKNGDESSDLNEAENKTNLNQRSVP